MVLKADKGKGIAIVIKKNYYDSLEQLFNDITSADLKKRQSSSFHG